MRLLERNLKKGEVRVMIDSIDVERHGRRRFLRSVAACAAMTSATAGAALLSCGDDDGSNVAAGGVRPDVSQDAGGNRPDVPEWPDGSTDAEVTDGGDTVESDSNSFPDVSHGADAGGNRPDVPEWPDGGPSDHVEVDVDSGQSYGILPDSGEPDRVEIDLDGAQPAGIMPDGGDE